MIEYEKCNIYYLTDNTNEVRYVGKTKNKLRDRLYQHLIDKDVTHKTNWIKKVGKKNIRIILIEECDNKFWIEREKYWINYYKNIGCNLTNSTDGCNKKLKNNFTIKNTEFNEICDTFFDKFFKEYKMESEYEKQYNNLINEFCTKNGVSMVDVYKSIIKGLKNGKYKLNFF